MTMRSTVNLDEPLLARAEERTGITDRSMLLKAALTALIERAASRRLAKLGGTEPQLEYIPRRRPPE